LTGGVVWAGTACTPRAGWVLVDGDRIAAIGEDDESSAELPSADEVSMCAAAMCCRGSWTYTCT